jgi:hypothetical protein
LQDLTKLKRVPKRQSLRKLTKVKIEEDIVHVKLSQQLQVRLGEAARQTGLSETEIIHEAIAEAISTRGRRKPN